MAETVIAAFTPVFQRDAVYQTTISFNDADGNPVPTLSASFIGIPNGDVTFTWDVGNGKFIPVSTGTYRFDLTNADTAAITWSSGRYRVEVVDSSGITFPCFIEGLMFTEDC